MTGINLNLSVFKRTTKPFEEVDTQLKNDGWTLTESIGANERIRYYEQSGINITVIGGPAGTVVLPSGPVRGMLFGDGVNILSKIGTIGDDDGASSDTRSGQISSSTHT